MVVEVPCGTVVFDAETGEYLCEAILGSAADTAESKVDLPAFGKPTRPTSASIFSSSTTERSTAGSPGWACGFCAI